MPIDEKRLTAMVEKLRGLSASKVALIEKAIDRHAARIDTTLAPNCKPFTQLWVDAMGDALQTHHAMSASNLGKDRFEYALIEAFEQCGIVAEPAGSRTNQGHDVTVAGEAWSLKSQGNKSIKPDRIWISKFMELGRGEWETLDDITAQRERFLKHMQGYSRIFTLRHWHEKTPEFGSYYFYELVEIPKALLEESKNATLEWATKTKQKTKPAYARVADDNAALEPEATAKRKGKQKRNDKFCLYFDAGTERKLQIKDIRKDFCKVVATWKFPV